MKAVAYMYAFSNFSIVLKSKLHPLEPGGFLVYCTLAREIRYHFSLRVFGFSCLLVPLANAVLLEFLTWQKCMVLVPAYWDLLRVPAPDQQLQIELERVYFV